MNLFMEFVCSPYYMQRVPGLPLYYAWHALNNAESIDDVDILIDSLKPKSRELFCLAVRIATGNGSIFNSKSHKSRESLLKYLLRMSARPTPFGLFAQVAFSEFCDVSTNLEENTNTFNVKLCVECSNLWLNQLINQTEKTNLRRIKYVRNNNCYVSGDRYYNTSYTNRANLSKNDTPFMTIDIRNTSAVLLMIELTETFVSFSELYNSFVSVYPNLSKDSFDQFLISLLEGEFLYSNLRVPAYQIDALDYLVQATSENNMIKLSKSLEVLQGIMSDFSDNPSIEKLEYMLNFMSDIHESDDYIVVTSGLVYPIKSLTSEVKDKLEKFASALSVIYVDKMDFCRLEKFKEQFYDYFEANTLVPLDSVINEHIFNGLRFLEDTIEKLSIREKHIQSVINQQVIMTLKEGRDFLELSLNDFSKDIVFPETSNDFLSSFDLNFIVSDSSGHIYIGPNYGALKQGNSFQRFYRLWPNILKNEVKAFYNQESLNYTEDILVDCFELQKYGKANNILNKKCNYNHCISFGTTLESEKVKELTINDLYLTLDKHRNLSIVERKTLKRVRIVNDNMLTSLSNSKVVQLLKEITYEYDRKKVVERLNIFNNLDFLYTPRIIFENVTVALETWRLDSSCISETTFEEFQSDLLKFRDKYIAKNIVYLSNNDNRLLINLDKLIFREILFKEYKKEGKLILQTPEDAVLLENEDFKYLTEYIVSLRQKSNKSINLEKNHFEMFYQYDEGSIVHFGEEGWVSINIYGLGKRVCEFFKEFKKVLCSLGESKVIKWFYVNYYDHIGQHLRLRIQFSKLYDYEIYNSFFTFLNRCCKKKTISNWHLVPYNREFSRYGGAALLEICENIFYFDSTETVFHDKYYLTEMATFSKLAQYGVHLFNTLEDFSAALDNFFKDDYNYRKHYRKESKKYMSLLEEAIGKSRIIKSDFVCSLEELRVKLQTEAISREYRESIVFSIMHMHCNRALNNLNTEKKLHHYLKFALWEIMNRNKLKLKIKEK